MDEKDFKKHLRDLAHGHHNPSEHDWGTDPSAQPKRAKVSKASAPRKRKRK